MTRPLALVLAFLVLLQTFGRELVVLDYAVYKERITAMFCVNKARPQLHCNGKCYLAKLLKRTTGETPGKGPAAGAAKLKLDVVLPARPAVPAAAPRFAVAARYAHWVAPGYAAAPLGGVFHPPAFRG